jgi:hypothetical protein
MTREEIIDLMKSIKFELDVEREVEESFANGEM